MCTTLSSYSVNKLLFQVPLMDVEQYDVLGKASWFKKQTKKQKNWRHFTGSITREDHMTSQHFHLYDFIFSCYKLLSICFSVASLVLLFLCLSCLFHKYENVCIKSCNLNCDIHFVYSIAWLLLWWDHSPWDYLHLWHKVTFGFIWHLFECGMSLQVSLLLYIQYGAIGVFWW